MRILLAAKHPPGGRLKIGGVLSWCTTVAAELRALGHQVEYWGPEQEHPEGTFDLGVFANVRYTGRATYECDRVVKISHGVIPDEAGGPEFLATSEEVRDRWGCKGIVRQPLDLEFWKPSGGRRAHLTLHSYRGRFDFLEGLAKSMGMTFSHCKDEPPEGVREHLRLASVVVATGRAAVEAMACGAAVVIADDRPYQGPLLDTDTLGSMTRNYSGRGGVKPTIQNMREAIRRAIVEGSRREHVETHHDVRKIVPQILKAA